MDILHDSSHRTWYQLGTKFASLIPVYVMDSEMQTKEAAEKLADREFADDGRRLFPIDSPAATWLSAAYFAKNAGAAYIPVLKTAVEARIKQAAGVYGIADDVEAIMAAVRTPDAVKSAADDDSNYGWVQKTAAGTERRYPMFDEVGVMKAAAYFVENRRHYPRDMRSTIAKAIMAKAAAYGVKVSDVVRREAGIGMPRRDTVMAELLERAHLCKDAESSAALANLNELVATAPMDELSGELDKIAEVIDTVDRLSGLDRDYGRRLLSPADFLYDIDPKVAEAALEDSVELARNVFSVTKLAELPDSVFSDVLGEDFLARVKTAEKIDKIKLADELYSLPAPDKRALEDHLQLLFQ